VEAARRGRRHAGHEDPPAHADAAGPDGVPVHPVDGRPWSSSSTNSGWRRALAKAGGRYRPAEQLRHMVASTLLSRGAPLLCVQALGGWRSAGVLVKVYARWIDDGLVSGASKVTARHRGPLRNRRRAQPTAPRSPPLLCVGGESWLRLGCVRCRDLHTLTRKIARCLTPSNTYHMSAETAPPPAIAVLTARISV